MINENVEVQENISLWNPRVAMGWSFLFVLIFNGSLPVIGVLSIIFGVPSVIFGAWIQAKNWTALGDGEKAKKSMYWVYGGMVIFLIALFMPENIRNIVSGYVLAWLLMFGFKQIKYVKENFDDKYDKKKWGKPLGIAVGVLIGWFVICGLTTLAFDSKAPINSTLEDISGVWRANTDGAMVTLRVAGKNKSIEINGNVIPVSVKDYDDENKIISFIVNNNSSAIWSIKQIIDDHGKFTLNLTLEDGTTHGLSFVRNL